MAKQVKSSKPRHANYEEKLKFSGSFEDILKVSVKDADKKIKPKPK